MNQLPSSSNKDLPYNALEDSPLAKQFEGLPSLHSLRIEYSGLQSQESETTTWPSLPLEIWKVVGGKVTSPLHLIIVTQPTNRRRYNILAH